MINCTDTNVFTYQDSPLGQGSQLMSVGVFMDGKGAGMASIDGRANLSNFRQDPRSNYNLTLDSIMTFKCHKVETGSNNNKQTTMFPVNFIGFNKRNDKYVYTGGSEGQMYFWDYEQKNKSKSFNFSNRPVCCSALD